MREREREREKKKKSLFVRYLWLFQIIQKKQKMVTGGKERKKKEENKKERRNNNIKFYSYTTFTVYSFHAHVVVI